MTKGVELCACPGVLRGIMAFRGGRAVCSVLVGLMSSATLCISILYLFLYNILVLLLASLSVLKDIKLQIVNFCHRLLKSSLS